MQATGKEWRTDGGFAAPELRGGTLTSGTGEVPIEALLDAPPGDSEEVSVEIVSPMVVAPEVGAAGVAAQRRGSAAQPISSGALGRRFSLEPTAHDLPPDAAPSRRYRLERHHWAAVGGGVILTIGILTLVATANGHGSLFVTAGRGATATPGVVRLLVDGILRCDELPCRVDELSPGRHVLRAESEQGTELAKVEVEIRADSETPVPLLLVREIPTQARTTQRSAARPEEGAEGSPGVERASRESTERTAAHLSRQLRRARAVQQPAATASADMALAAASAVPAARLPTASDGNGTLIVTGEPSGLVIVDGQPRGWTPKTITLPAGPHSVSVQHPELGSQSADVTIRARSSTVLRIDL